MIEFELQDHEFIELNKLLKITGLCDSGGNASHLITDRQVKVDQQVETRKRCKIRKGQIVEALNQKIIIC